MKLAAVGVDVCLIASPDTEHRAHTAGRHEFVDMLDADKFRLRPIPVPDRAAERKGERVERGERADVSAGANRDVAQRRGGGRRLSPRSSAEMYCC